MTLSTMGVRYHPFRSEDEDLPPIMKLIDEQLSEPYSIFTYRYFVSQWPELCFLARESADLARRSDVDDQSRQEDGHSNSSAVYPGQSDDGNDQTSVSANANMEGRCVGAIVCKMDFDRPIPRGYIAMLVVVKEFRGQGIASHLVSLCVERMLAAGCGEVTLEAEVTNEGALALYGRLGFLRAKRLHRYYLNGSDAFRLKLRLPSHSAQTQALPTLAVAS